MGMALAQKQGVSRSGISFGFEALPPEMCGFAFGVEDLHMSLPLTPLVKQRIRPPPDEAILSAERPARRHTSMAYRGGQRTPKSAGQEEAEAEAALAEAIRMSIQDGTEDVSMEPADED